MYLQFTNTRRVGLTSSGTVVSAERQHELMVWQSWEMAELYPLTGSSSVMGEQKPAVSLCTRSRSENMTEDVVLSRCH